VEHLFADLYQVRFLPGKFDSARITGHKNGGRIGRLFVDQVGDASLQSLWFIEVAARRPRYEVSIGLNGLSAGVVHRREFRSMGSRRARWQRILAGSVAGIAAAIRAAIGRRALRTVNGRRTVIIGEGAGPGAGAVIVVVTDFVG
jgi:hypothetical protein